MYSSLKTFDNMQTGAGLRCAAYGLGGGEVVLTTENNDDNDTRYTNQKGYTSRFRTEHSTDGTTPANGTSAEWVLVCQTNNGSGSLPTIVAPSTVNSHRIVEVQGAAPSVAAFTRGGASSSSLSFSTTFSGTGRYAISGLDAATYNVTEDGTPVSGSPFSVTTAGRSLTFDAGSGSIVITQGTPPPSIDQTSLPGGTVGVSYSQTLTATGGGGGNDWTIISGTICGGLSLTAATGAITGTPTTAQTCSFTVQVEDDDMGTDTQALSIIVAAAPSAGGGTRFSGGVRCNGCRIQ